MKKNSEINNLKKKVGISNNRFYIEPKWEGGGLCETQKYAGRIYIGKD